eukprot:gb/GECG01010381.1/.p1 GENE.gb/GECG01010381.1/~~gb/GECG01010381.1/.p1  ORF type:complete len:1401 (+),score=150.24 gb/GECG01010381.1/:1-4203(+)
MSWRNTCKRRALARCLLAVGCLVPTLSDRTVRATETFWEPQTSPPPWESIDESTGLEESYLGCPFGEGKNSPCTPFSPCFDYREPTEDCMGPPKDGKFGDCCDIDEQCGNPGFCYRKQRTCSVGCRSDNDCPINEATGLAPSCIIESNHSEGVCDARSRITATSDLRGFCVRCLGQGLSHSCKENIVQHCADNLQTDQKCESESVRTIIEEVHPETSGTVHNEQCLLQVCNFNGICEDRENVELCPYDCLGGCPFDSSIEGNPCSNCSLDYSVYQSPSEECVPRDAVSAKQDFGDCCDSDLQCSSGICDWERRVCTQLCTTDEECPREPLTGTSHCEVHRTDRESLCLARSPNNETDSSLEHLEGFCATCIGSEPSDRCLENITAYCQGYGRSHWDEQCKEDWILDVPIDNSPQIPHLQVPRILSPTQNVYYEDDRPVVVALEHDLKDALIMVRVRPGETEFFPYTSPQRLTKAGKYAIDTYATHPSFQGSDIIEKKIHLVDANSSSPLPAPLRSPAPSTPSTQFTSRVDLPSEIRLSSKGVSTIPLEVEHNSPIRLLSVSFDYGLTDEKKISRASTQIREVGGSQKLVVLPHRGATGLTILRVNATVEAIVPKAYELPRGIVTQWDSSNYRVKYFTDSASIGVVVTTDEVDLFVSPTPVTYATAQAWGLCHFQTFAGTHFQYMGLGPHLLYSDGRYNLTIDVLLERWEDSKVAYIDAVSVSSELLRSRPELSASSIFPSIVVTSRGECVVDGYVLSFSGYNGVSHVASATVGRAHIFIGVDHVQLRFIDGTSVMVAYVTGGMLQVSVTTVFPSESGMAGGLLGSPRSSVESAVSTPGGNSRDPSRMTHQEIFDQLGRAWVRSPDGSNDWERTLHTVFGRNWKQVVDEASAEADVESIFKSTLFGNFETASVDWERMSAICAYNTPSSAILDELEHYSPLEHDEDAIAGAKMVCSAAYLHQCSRDIVLLENMGLVLETYRHVIDFRRDSIISSLGVAYDINAPLHVLIQDGTLSKVAIQASMEGGHSLAGDTKSSINNPPEADVIPVSGKSISERSLSVESDFHTSERSSTHWISMLPNALSETALTEEQLLIHVSTASLSVSFELFVSVYKHSENVTWITSVEEPSNENYSPDQKIPIRWKWRSTYGVEGARFETRRIGGVEFGLRPAAKEVSPSYSLSLRNTLGKKEIVGFAVIDESKTHEVLDIPGEVAYSDGYFIQFDTFSSIPIPLQSIKSSEFAIFPEAEWVTTAWRECSSQCGPGFERRDVFCVSNKSGDIVDELLCSLSPKPSAEAVCIGRACDEKEMPQAAFLESSWSECSVTCGHGFRTRDVFCVSRTGEVLEDFSPCIKAGKAIPAENETCTMQECPEYEWIASKWEDCDVFCGNGTQRRNVFLPEFHY